MMLVFVFLVFQPLHGLLLEPGNSTIQGKPVYLTAAEYYQDKIQLEQKMVSHGEINLLASQLQNKLDAFEQKFLTQTTSGTGQTSVVELEQKYQALEQKNRVLEQALASKELEMAELMQNLMLEMKELKHNLTCEINELKQNLTQTEPDLNQRLANETLYHLPNKTLYHLPNETLYHLPNETSYHLPNETSYHLPNETLYHLPNETLYHLQKYVDHQLQPVVLTACNESQESTVERFSPLLFPHILTSVGVPDEPHFQQTGRFRCSSPGYYYVTTTIESVTDYTYIYIMVNSDLKHRQYVTGKTDGALTSGTTGVTLHLTTGDEVWIQQRSSDRTFSYSCFTIFKVK